VEDPKEIAQKINSLKKKIEVDLVEISKHLEKLGKIMQQQQNLPGSLRCKGFMRNTGAMLRGINNIRLSLVLPEVEESETELLGIEEKIIENA